MEASILCQPQVAECRSHLISSTVEILNASLYQQLVQLLCRQLHFLCYLTGGKASVAGFILLFYLFTANLVASLQDLLFCHQELLRFHTH